ncbi:MAG: restriction modification system specificity domain protein [Oscillospiraceae bacterium]|jgi:type I restriction enzyme S subunit|nr:restriction modification system specificity domain protein [Oscillospiraceae bacterium]
MGKWKMVQLGDVVTFDMKSQAPQDISADDIYIGLEDIEKNSGKIIYPIKKVCNSDIKSNKFRFNSKHILYGKLRPNLNKVALPDFSGVCSTDIYPILPDSKKVNRSYLCSILREQAFVAFSSSKTTGINLPRIGSKTIAEYQFPLPPLDVQKRIADVLDKASALIELRRAQLDKLDLLIKSQFIQMFGDPVTNPMGWTSYHLEEVYYILDGDRGKNYPKQDEFYDNEYCLFLNTGNVTANGFNFVNNQFITKDKDTALNKGKLSRYDLVVTTRGTVGNIAYYDDTVSFENIRINSGMVILRQKSNIASKFFISYFKNPSVYKRLISGTAQPQMPIGSMKKAKVFMPPLSLQNEFAIFVDNVEQQKIFLQQSLAKLELNYKSLMQKCFRGEIF